jgi:hypothetical protein
MRFWLCVSLLLAFQSFSTSGAQLPPRISPQVASKATAQEAHETLLAGLRPGFDSLPTAEKRFKSKNLVEDRDTGTREWRDECSGRAIRLEFDAKSTIQSITITALGSKDSKCGNRPAEFLESKNWVTGLGLRIGDSQDRIIELYGDPNSSGPAVKNGYELELMFYQFDWAGPAVPQVMEVLCARDTGRVVEITLAFPSL